MQTVHYELWYRCFSEYSLTTMFLTARDCKGYVEANGLFFFLKDIETWHSVFINLHNLELTSYGPSFVICVNSFLSYNIF